jgi:Xaa-Pro aminopeptidase
MKSELDTIMQARNIDVMLLTGPAQHNPPMYYFTGGGNITRADLIKKRGERPVLFYAPMERGEAAKTGLPTKNIDDYHFQELIKKAGGNNAKARSMLYQRMLEDLNIDSGNVVIGGRIDAGDAYTIFNALQDAMPGLNLTGGLNDTTLSQAMVIKDEEEIGRIRQAGKLTAEVMFRVQELLQSCKVIKDVLHGKDGNPLLVGEVKQQINLWLAELGLENPEQTIFSIGRDAGVPHSTGNALDTLQLGKTIVFDIFPCEAGGGYFYDMTRTWCLGYAPEADMKLYEDVRSVFDQVRSELKVGELCQIYQKRVCELFEAKGHPTIKENPQTLEGYVHSLGHGVGLNIHERPWFGEYAQPQEQIAPGMVFTIEPGLYYPERGMGVRLEDTVYVCPDGTIETMANYPYDLIIPL